MPVYFFRTGKAIVDKARRLNAKAIIIVKPNIFMPYWHVKMRYRRRILFFSFEDWDYYIVNDGREGVEHIIDALADEYKVERGCGWITLSRS